MERRRLRSFLLTLAVIGIPLAVLAVAGATVALRQVERQRDAEVERMAGVIAALVGEAQDALRREAVVLARDPAVVESAVRRDWGPLARWGTLRILTLTRAGAADLVVLRDARGTPIVQVPPLARVPAIPAEAAAEPRVSLGLVGDRPYVLAAAALPASPAGDAPGPSPGTLVVGRSVEALGQAVEKLPGRPRLAFVAGDRVAGAAGAGPPRPRVESPAGEPSSPARAASPPGAPSPTVRAEAPAGGWAAAVRAGRAVLGDETFALRPLVLPESSASSGALWALVPEADTSAPVRRLRGWLIALSAAGAIVLALGAGVAVGAFDGRRRNGPARAVGAPATGDPGPGAGTAAARDGAAEAPGYEARALEEVTEIIESALDPRPLLKQVAMATARACRVDRCSIERWDGDHVIALTSQFADGRRDAGLWAAFTQASNDPPRRAPINARAIETRGPVVVDDVTASDLVPREWIEAFGHKSVMVVPLLRKEHVIGVMTLDYAERATPFAPWQVSLGKAIARRLSLAIENARLFQDNQRRVDELSVLHEMSRAVTGQLDRADLLDTIHLQLARLLDVRHLVVMLHEAGSDRLEVVLRVVDGVRRDGAPQSYPRVGIGLAGIVLDTGRALYTGDYVGECARRGVVPAPENAALPNWLGVPMVAGDERLGVLALRSPDRAYTEGDEAQLASIADLAALALRSARLYEEATRAHAELAAAQDQLVRTEKLRAMGQMASGMAHDFNNVLSAILGRAQLLRARVEDPALAQWLLVIERAAMDGARTVRRLQEFTRIRRDQPAEPVDLNRVVEETLEATEPSWRQGSLRGGVAIEVETALAASPPVVSGDPAELREALTNVILNAVDAMPEGGRLRVTTRALGRSVEVTVTDTGTGIAEGVRDRIFDPFFTTKGPKGTGLGLSMTYGILARHDGRITVESEEGSGTTFRIVFPSTSDAPPAPAPAAAPAAAGATPAAAAALRCLIVDDEAAVAAVLADMLEALGHLPAVAGSGPEALGRLRAEAFDLVLTDLAMPGMTGWELAAAAKALVPGLPVFLVTGFGVEVGQGDPAGHVVDLVLAKPLQIRDLTCALAQVTPRSGGRP